MVDRDPKKIAEDLHWRYDKITGDIATGREDGTALSYLEEIFEARLSLAQNYRALGDEAEIIVRGAGVVDKLVADYLAIERQKPYLIRESEDGC